MPSKADCLRREFKMQRGEPIQAKRSLFRFGKACCKLDGEGEAAFSPFLIDCARSHQSFQAGATETRPAQMDE